MLSEVCASGMYKKKKNKKKALIVKNMKVQ